MPFQSIDEFLQICNLSILLVNKHREENAIDIILILGLFLIITID